MTTPDVSHLLTPEYLAGKYAWAVDVPARNGIDAYTFYLYTKLDPATEAPEQLVGTPARKTYLESLRGTVSDARLAEMAINAHAERSTT